MRMLVKNIANSNATGDVIGIFSDNHEFGTYEQKTMFIKKYDAIEWPRQFVVVNVPDADVEAYTFLLETNDVGKTFYIEPQGVDSPFYNQLLDTAEVTVDTSILNSLIRNRL